MEPEKITLRREEPADYKEVEALTREAFWNHFVPGCDEHYLAHALRDAPCFLPELDWVAVAGGQIVGNIMYTRAQIRLDGGQTLPVLSFGPLSVLPAFQKQGVGGALIRHTVQLAQEAGHSAILIYGDPAYYSRHGFVPAERYGIAGADRMYRDALQALPLQSGALDNTDGLFLEDDAYHVDAGASEAFDRAFPLRDKVAGTPSQQRFMEVLTLCKPKP